MEKKKIMKKLFILMFFLVCCISTNIYATDDWWGSASDFFDGVSWSKDNTILSSLVDIIKVLGNAVFIIVAIVLGIKYMLGSAEGKADIKEGIISLTVAMVFFYGWSALENILTGGGSNLVFIADSAETTIANIYSTIVYFLNIIAVGAVAYVGIKYLLSGAEGKADLKGKGVPFVVGMILTFSTLTFLNFIRDIIVDVL